MVEVLARVAALLQNRAPTQWRDPAGDNPKWLARGVVIDGADHQSTRLHQHMLPDAFASL
jgi:hypothetical protein